MIIRNKFNGYVGGNNRLYPGGGGGQSQPTNTTQTTTTIPEYARPAVERMLGKAEAFSETPYQAYGGQRIAEFAPMQQQAFQSAANLGPAQQLGIGTQMAGLAGLRGLNTSYTPTSFQNQYQAPRQFTPSTFGGTSVNAPNLQQFQMGPAERVSGAAYSAPEMQAAQTGFNPYLQQFQMGPAERVGIGSFRQPGTAEEYMSPYQQAVTDIEKREATRQSNMLGQQLQGQAVQQGAFGGSRSALVEAERQRNLGQQLGDIQTRGSQSAFQQAREQFNAENLQAGLQAQLANQQAGLTTGQQNLASLLGVQQLGTQTGLQTSLANLSSAQQANVQNQAAQLQTQGLNADQAMRAALANQQAGLTTGQQNLAALLGVQQFGAGQDLQSQLANQQYGLEAQRLGEQSRQYGYGQDMSAAQLAAQYGTDAQRMSEQSRQFGSDLGLRGYGLAGQMAGTLGQLGQTQFGQQQGAIQAQAAAGAQQQAQEQQRLTQAYQDFLTQRGYPQQQLSFMSDILRGVPLGQQTQVQYQAPPPMASQLAQLGLGAYGFSQMMKKDGGIIKGYAEGGITDAAPQGSVPNTMSIDKLRSVLGDMSEGQLDQVAADAGDATTLALVQEQKSLNARIRNANILAEAIPETTIKDEMVASDMPVESGIAAAPLPAAMFADTAVGETPEETPAMRGGGIVAFAKGKEVKAAPVPDDTAILRAMNPSEAFVTEGERTQNIQTGLKQLEEYMGKDRSIELAEKIAKSSELSPEAESRAKMATAFEMMAAFGEPTPFATAFGKAGAIAGRNIKEFEKLKRDSEREANKLRLDTARYERAEKRGNYTEANNIANRIEDRKTRLYGLEADKNKALADIQLKEKQIASTEKVGMAQVAATRAASGRLDYNRDVLGKLVKQGVADFVARTGQQPNEQQMAVIEGNAARESANLLKVDPYGAGRLDATVQGRINDAKKNDRVLSELNIALYGADEKDKPAIRAQMAERDKEIEAQIRSQVSQPGNTTTQPPPPATTQALQPGQIVVDANGNRAKYVGGDPKDPKSYAPV
jgi:hypothetical protein